MAIQERNDELVDILSADFVRNKLPSFVYGQIGGRADYSLDNVAGTAISLIPDAAAYDVKQFLYYRAVVVTSSAVRFTVEGNVGTNATSDLYNSGSDILRLTVASSGAVSIARAGGTLTYDLQLHLEWI